MKLLTIFTPTYNRKHTICRTYESLQRQTCKDFNWLIIDDGSSDGTRQWVESLGNKVILEGIAYDWMGCPLKESTSDHFIIEANGMCIEYVAKPNGGLYTGYNVAYATIETELCVCIDSDDYAADDTVEKISNLWKSHYPDGSLINHHSSLTNKEYCGIIGLDFNLDGTPLGGYFPSDLTECYRADLSTAGIHTADSKEVMRTKLMRQVAPQIGFEGEKNFNPSYMLGQVYDKYPILVLNENLCFVDYQYGADSMSQGIWRQYVNSPKSYAKHRIMHMKLTRTPYSAKFKHAAHYISSCIFAKDKDWFKNTPMKITTLAAIPLGIVFNLLIRYKSGK